MLLAHTLYQDDVSRSAEVPVATDGRAAYDGWCRSAREAGDSVTLDALLAVDRDDFAAAWEALASAKR